MDDLGLPLPEWTCLPAVNAGQEGARPLPGGVAGAGRGFERDSIKKPSQRYFFNWTLLMDKYENDPDQKDKAKLVILQRHVSHLFPPYATRFHSCDSAA